MKFLLKLISGLIAIMLLATASMVAATWQPDRTVEELSERWAPAPSQFITVNGQQVLLRDEGPKGDATPIVLLHGTSASLHTWDGWTQELSKTRRVIRFDLPGFGLTGPAADNDYHLAAYVSFVKSVLDTVGVQRCILGGNSLGGAIAWHTAVSHPQLIEKLILVDSGGYPFKPESMPIAFVISQTPVLNQIMEMTLPRAAVESSVRSVYGDPERVTADLVDRYFDLTLRQGNRAALRERFAQTEYTDQSDLVQTITQPTLVLWGDQDRLIPLDIAKQFEQDLPNGKLIMFEGLGHVPHEEDPVATLASVVDFL